MCWSFQFHTPPQHSPVRYGILGIVNSVDDVERNMKSILERLEKHIGSPEHTLEPINVVHLALVNQAEKSHVCDQQCGSLALLRKRMEY